MLARVLSALIWLMFFEEGIRSGFVLPYWQLSDVGDRLSISAKVMILAIPFILFFAAEMKNHKEKNRGGFIKKLINPDVYEAVVKRTRFAPTIFFLLAGTFATMNCILVNAPELNLYFSLALLSGGLGLAMHRLVVSLILTGESQE